MSIDKSVENPTRLAFDFVMKKEKPPSFGRKLTIGLAGLSLLAAAASVAWSRIPEQPPNVFVLPGKVEVEPYAYTGDYLTRFFDGRTTLMTLSGGINYGDTRWYKDTKGDGKVHEIIDGRHVYEREKDLAKHPDIFKRADEELRQVVAKYVPYIQMATIEEF